MSAGKKTIENKVGKDISYKRANMDADGSANGGGRTNSGLSRSSVASFKSRANKDAKDGHGYKPTSHRRATLPSQDHSSGSSFMTLTENQGFQDTSRRVNIVEQVHSYESNLVLDNSKPYQADFHKESLIEALDRTDSDRMSSARNKDYYTAIKFTGSRTDERIFLSGVASAFYDGGSLSLHSVLPCSGITKIKYFLDERRDELHAGVPGKWLTIVLGKASSDLSNIAATIMYSYFLALTTKQDQLCIVPLINMARADLALNPDITWLLTSIGIHTASLLFLNEVNLSYFHRFGGLRLVLVNHTQLCPSQESFRDDVQEILSIHDEVDSTYPNLKSVISDEDVGSSCTLIAESYTKHHPEELAGRALCRLLLAGILLDTKNLTTELTTRRDVSMVTLLLNGAGKFGRNGLFKILKQKSHDLSSMNTNELLRKEFKKLNFAFSGMEAAKGNSQQFEESLGMSSLPISLSEVLSWEENSLDTVAKFPNYMGLRMFVLVTGYYEIKKTFKREVLVVSEDLRLMESLSMFLLANTTPVKFVPMLKPGLPSSIRGFALEGKRISRTVIQDMIEDYFSR